MADAVAIVSVASSATVAVLNMAFQSRRARLEAYGHRVEDLRETIDQALAPVLNATMQLQFTMRARSEHASPVTLISPMPADFDPVQGLREADRLRIEVWRWDIGLEMRLGANHPIGNEYRAALGCLRRASAVLARCEGADGSLSRVQAKEIWSHLDAAYRAQMQMAQDASDLIGISSVRPWWRRLGWPGRHATTGSIGSASPPG
jgi:hypothetical protein